MSGSSLPTIAADFHGLPISILDHAGQRWLTATEVGRCLGYNEANARQGILKLYRNNAAEFSEFDKGVVEMATPGGKQEVTIFSATGCILLGFFSNTARAKDFRAWAKTALAAPAASAPHSATLSRIEAQMTKLAGHMATVAAGTGALLMQQNSTAKYIGLLELNQVGQVRVTREIEKQVFELVAQGMSYQSVGRLLRIGRSTVSMIARGKYGFSDAAGEPCATPELVAAAIERRLADERQKLLQISHVSPPVQNINS